MKKEVKSIVNLHFDSLFPHTFQRVFVANKDARYGQRGKLVVVLTIFTKYGSLNIRVMLEICQRYVNNFAHIYNDTRDVSAILRIHVFTMIQE